MKRSSYTTWLFLTFCLLVLLYLTSPFFESMQAATTPKDFHVSGVQIPGSLTNPAAIEGGTLNTGVFVTQLIIANTDLSNGHTVTVQDCTPTTPFILLNGYTIAAGSTWFLPLGGTRFTGCFKWSASDTTVMGTVVGTR